MGITTTAQSVTDGAQRYGNEIAMAIEMVTLYRRVR
jgi:hypothetical protein